MIALRIGYLPLTDAGSLIIAAERGFAAGQGLRLDLRRETTWASLRDNLIVGNLEAAHCLAPLAIAASLGIGHPPAALTIPMLLSVNGNAVTVSAELSAAIGQAAESLVERAAALVQLARRRKAAGRPLTIATVFRFSAHTLLLRHQG
jgi:two-component system, oxyanion-binding sensor